MQDLSAQGGYDTRNFKKPRANALRIYARLVGYAWRYKGRLIASILLALLVAGSLSSMIVSVGAAVKVVYGDPQKVDETIHSFSAAIDDSFLPAPRDLDERLTALAERMRRPDQRGYALSVLCAVLIALSLVGGAARFLQEYFAGAIGANISVTLGQEMFDNVVRQPLPFFEKRSSGELLARFANDVFMVNRGLAGVFVKLFREPFKLVTFFIMAVLVDPFLTLVTLLVIPPVLYVIVRIGKKVRKSVYRSLAQIASVTSVINETASGIQIIKVFTMEPYEQARVGERILKLRKHLLRMVKADAAIGPITEFLLVIGLVTFIMLAGRAVEGGNLDGGDLIWLFGALGAMVDPIRKLSTVNNLIQTSVASAERVFEFIDAKPDLVEAADAVDIAPLRDALRFEDVYFSYDGENDVLKGVNLEIKKGEMVALVGFSGAGKTTLAKLVPRFYDVTGGAITIDGVDIRKATLKSLREQVGIVTQDTILFDETIRKNITHGREDYADDRILQAAHAAHAAEFIENLPDGYDTVIGESGGTLSGGQRQRLAIARAVIKDPAILILDEATSSLDSESERAIQEAIEQFVVGRTSIVIAHRLSTVRRADRIVVLDAGRVVEEGRHEDLLTRGGRYQRLYETQFASNEQAEEAE